MLKEQGKKNIFPLNIPTCNRTFFWYALAACQCVLSSHGSYFGETESRQKLRSGITLPKFLQESMISSPYQVSDLISQDISTVDTVSNWLIVNLGQVNYK